MSDEHGNVYDYEKLENILTQIATLAQQHPLAVVVG
jgi:hypothetical protein